MIAANPRRVFLSLALLAVSLALLIILCQLLIYAKPVVLLSVCN